MIRTVQNGILGLTGPLGARLAACRRQVGGGAGRGRWWEVVTRNALVVVLGRVRWWTKCGQEGSFNCAVLGPGVGLRCRERSGRWKDTSRIDGIGQSASMNGEIPSIPRRCGRDLAANFATVTNAVVV